jgi:lysozyme
VGGLERAQTICPKGQTIMGVDVSHYDGTIDWTKAHAAGVEFAFMKATEGLTITDGTYATNLAGARAAGVIAGAYHFFRANLDGTQQADFFVSVIGTVPPDALPPVIDLETTDGQSASAIASAALEFLARVEQRTGRTPLIYTTPSFFTSTLGSPSGFSHYPVWIAHWTTTCPNVPSAWSDWPFWQYTDSGSVNGISTPVDLDKFNGTRDDLIAFLGLATDGGTPTDTIVPPQDAGRDTVGTSDSATDAAGDGLLTGDAVVAGDAVVTGDGARPGSDGAAAGAGTLGGSGDCSCTSVGASSQSPGGLLAALLVLLTCSRRVAATTRRHRR